MPRTNATTGDLRTLVDQFTADLTAVTKRIALEDLHAKLQSVLGDSSPKRRGPGRPRKAAATTAAVPQKRKRGKRTAADLGKMGAALLAHVRANPGQRADQIAAALGTDVGTMRLPMRQLIAERKVRTEGQRRGTTYFAGARKAKRAAPKKKRSGRKAKPARKAKATKRKRPTARGTLTPQARRKPKAVEVAPVVAEPVPAGVA